MIKADMMKRGSQNDLKKDPREVLHKRLGYSSQRIFSVMMDYEKYNIKDVVERVSRQCKTCF